MTVRGEADNYYSLNVSSFLCSSQHSSPVMAGMVDTTINEAAIAKVRLCRLTNTSRLHLSQHCMDHIRTVRQRTTINKPLRMVIKRCHSTMQYHHSSMGCRRNPNTEAIASHHQCRHRLRLHGGLPPPQTDKHTTITRRPGKHNGKSRWACKELSAVILVRSVLMNAASLMRWCLSPRGCHDALFCSGEFVVRYTSMLSLTALNYCRLLHVRLVVFALMTFWLGVLR